MIGAGAAKAGAAYFLLVFAAGFILGTIRTFAVAPAIGETGAVILELPFMLLVSWFGCRWIIRALSVPHRAAPRIVMGLSAFVLLLGAEALLSVTLLNHSLMQHLALYLNPAHQLGLLGQIAFGVFPLVQLRLSETENAKRGSR